MANSQPEPGPNWAGITSEQRAAAAFAMTTVIFVVWIGVVAWFVIEHYKSRKRTDAALERLEEITRKANPARGGDGASITDPAP